MEEKISENAHGYFMSGLNCAESVLRATLEQIETVDPRALQMATPFGGGIGGTKQELCGALAGGLMALGYLSGRLDPETDAGPAEAAAAALRDRFLLNATGTQCQALVDRFGPENQTEQCALLVAHTAGWVSDFIYEQGLFKEGKDQ